MLKLARDLATASGREMSFEEKCQLLQNSHYNSDYYIFDEETTNVDDSD